MQYRLNEYLIIMNDYDDFIIRIKQDVNRPNNPDDNELIKEYMDNRYYGHSYRAYVSGKLKGRYFGKQKGRIISSYIL